MFHLKTNTSDVPTERFYCLLSKLAEAPGQARPLREIGPKSPIPSRGVYFFLEPGEFRTVSPGVPRVVRVGTHAVYSGSKASLRNRLRRHLGTRSGGGNHRGSIFRLHVGAAMLARDRTSLPTWGAGSTTPKEVRISPEKLAEELACEKRVSEYLGGMPVLWIGVSDEPRPQSDRAFIERNAIALLSNHLAPIDLPSSDWLGRFSPKSDIRESGLWNLNHVADDYDSSFLEMFDRYVQQTSDSDSRLAKSCP